MGKNWKSWDSFRSDNGVVEEKPSRYTKEKHWGLLQACELPIDPDGDLLYVRWLGLPELTKPEPESLDPR